MKSMFVQLVLMLMLVDVVEGIVEDKDLHFEVILLMQQVEVHLIIL
jgi:hypothetical protein